MRNITYILLPAILLLTSCSGLEKMSEARAERLALKKEAVKTAIEQQRMVLSIDRFYTKRGRPVGMRPESNFVIIDGDKIRISLGYMGRSHSIRPISAINMSGRILSREIGVYKNGGYDMSIEASQDNERFRIHLIISGSGQVDLSIINTRIDMARYAGRLKTAIT